MKGSHSGPIHTHVCKLIIPHCTLQCKQNGVDSASHYTTCHYYCKVPQICVTPCIAHSNVKKKKMERKQKVPQLVKRQEQVFGA